MMGVRGSSGKWNAWAWRIKPGTLVPISIRFSHVEHTPLCLGPRPSVKITICHYKHIHYTLSLPLTLFPEGDNSHSHMHFIGSHLGGGADGVVALNNEKVQVKE